MIINKICCYLLCRRIHLKAHFMTCTKNCKTTILFVPNVNEYVWFCPGDGDAVFIILCSLDALELATACMYNVYVSRRYKTYDDTCKQTSQHIDDTSGHSQNVNYQITSDILLRALFLCVFVHSFVLLLQWLFSTAWSRLIFNWFFPLLLLFLLCIAFVCIIFPTWTVQIDIEMFSAHIIRGANRNK